MEERKSFMFCGKCGKQVSNDIQFCPYCGFKLFQAQPIPVLAVSPPNIPGSVPPGIVDSQTISKGGETSQVAVPSAVAPEAAPIWESLHVQSNEGAVGPTVSAPQASTNLGSESARAKIEKRLPTIVGLVFILPLLICSLIPAGISILVSFTKFDFMDGIFGSPFHGFQNFLALFETTFSTILKSSALTSLYAFIALLFPLGMGVLCALFLPKIQSGLSKAMIVSVLMFPAFLPTGFWIHIFRVTEGMASSNSNFVLRGVLNTNLVLALQWMGPVALISTCMAVLAPRSVLTKLSGVFASLLIMMAVGVQPGYDLASLQIDRNSFVFASTLTGLQQSNFSRGAAIWSMKSLFQVIPAVLAGILLSILLRNVKKQMQTLEIEPKKKKSSLVFVLLFIGVGIGFFVSLIGFVIPAVQGLALNTLYTSIAISITIILFALMIGLASLGSFTKNPLVPMILAFLCVFSGNYLGEYLLLHSLRLLNNGFTYAIFIAGTQLPLVIGGTCLVFLGGKKVIGLLFPFLGIAAVQASSNIVYSNLFMRTRSPLSFVAYLIDTYQYAEGMGDEPKLIGLALTLICLGIWIWSCTLMVCFSNALETKKNIPSNLAFPD
jgi:hypothetical protein